MSTPAKPQGARPDAETARDPRRLCHACGHMEIDHDLHSRTRACQECNCAGFRAESAPDSTPSAPDAECGCNDPEGCYDAQLLADRDAGWKRVTELEADLEAAQRQHGGEAALRAAVQELVDALDTRSEFTDKGRAAVGPQLRAVRAALAAPQQETR